MNRRKFLYASGITSIIVLTNSLSSCKKDEAISAIGLGASNMMEMINNHTNLNAEIIYIVSNATKKIDLSFGKKFKASQVLNLHTIGYICVGSPIRPPKGELIGKGINGKTYYFNRLEANKEISFPLQSEHFRNKGKKVSYAYTESVNKIYTVAL